MDGYEHKASSFPIRVAGTLAPAHSSECTDGIFSNVFPPNKTGKAFLHWWGLEALLLSLLTGSVAVTSSLGALTFVLGSVTEPSLQLP